MKIHKVYKTKEKLLPKCEQLTHAFSNFLKKSHLFSEFMSASSLQTSFKTEPGSSSSTQGMQHHTKSACEIRLEINSFL
jgi:hypothetical protein